jgi:hypothetical protein
MAKECGTVDLYVNSPEGHVTGVTTLRLPNTAKLPFPRPMNVPHRGADLIPTPHVSTAPYKLLARATE